MATWVAPATATGGSTALTASFFNAEVRDHALWLKGFADLISANTAADSGAATYLSITRATDVVAFQSRISGDSDNRLRISAGGVVTFGNGSGANDVSMSRSSAGRVLLSGTNAQLLVEQNAGGTDRNQLATWLSGDTQPRVALGMNSADRAFIAWGPGGATAPDFSLMRIVAGRLDAAAPTVTGGARIGVTVDTNESSGFFVWRTGDTAARVSIGQDADGVAALRFGNGSGAPYEELYRLGGGVIGSNAALRFIRTTSDGAVVSRVAGDSYDRFFLYISGRQDWGDGANPIDTNLYRQAAGRLQSDYHLRAVQGIGTFTKAGAISDADWTTAPPVGTIAIDTTNFKVYIRTAAATWKSSAAFT